MTTYNVRYRLWERLPRYVAQATADTPDEAITKLKNRLLLMGLNPRTVGPATPETPPALADFKSEV